ncbi:hypothetical protein RZS28_18680 (plasmid) [Methylocapsa polymorpha]|uniref:Uncharacterized protein n=1 Tax=Methylocapsa polymorpha TaxID=3080828 RepID=A0ABZ0HZJ1_9HYPH|nr:hypothetical protein [Methylocapsa sp. RX1]WOJ91755.1 hypothetical protein RZS28_18680 [Methylocapsa sp. RX1]
MPTQTDELQALWRRYEHDHEHLPASAREVVEWAVEEGLLDLPEIDPLDILASQMSRALREEYATDEEGRRYRKNHAVRVTKNGIQTTFWGIMGFANRSHMERAFTQRREQVIGDCLQLQIDVEAYNAMNPIEKPIQLVLDFADDVAERRAA